MGSYRGQRGERDVMSQDTKVISCHTCLMGSWC